MARRVSILCAVCFMLAVFGIDARGEHAGGALRLGVYDNRAIAVAYAHSKLNPVSEKVKEQKKAREEGDTKRVKELDAWGEKHQRELHRQGFGRVPVNDILAQVRDKLPEIARKARVDAIAWQCDYAGQNVEVVDITRELVLLFDPSEKTLKAVEEVKKHAPLDLDEIEQHHEH
ncbi:MAG: hypothetical protein WCP22_02400 [Chlamydiota bacterium]